MMKRYQHAFAAAAFVLTAIFLYCYFSVAGTQIREIESISEHYTATVIKNHGALDERQSEYTLTAHQILRLKELIQSSRFIRRFSPDFSYKGLKDTYHITLELRDSHGQQQDFLSLYCVEDLYLNIWATSPESQDHYLMIRNLHWHQQLDRILNENGQVGNVDPPIPY